MILVIKMRKMVKIKFYFRMDLEVILLKRIINYPWTSLLKPEILNHNQLILIVTNHSKMLLNTSNIEKIAFLVKSLENTTSISKQKKVKSK